MMFILFAQATTYGGRSLDQRLPNVVMCRHLHHVQPPSGAGRVAARVQSCGSQPEPCSSPAGLPGFVSHGEAFCSQCLERGEGPHRWLPGALPRVGHPPSVLALQLQLLLRALYGAHWCCLLP